MYHILFKVISAVLFGSFPLCASTTSNLVDYKKMGMWHTGQIETAKKKKKSGSTKEIIPTDIQIIEGQNSVDSTATGNDKIKGVNKLLVKTSEIHRYSSGLYNIKEGEKWLALAEVLAKLNFEGFDKAALNSLKKCLDNSSDKDYKQEQEAAVLFFKAIAGYSKYCLDILKVDDEKKLIACIVDLAGIMYSEETSVYLKLSKALECLAKKKAEDENSI